MPDAPQRIATDTSQKLPIRFGETIKAYQAKGLNMDELVLIPLVLAGYARYLKGVNDAGKPFEPSPDPLLEELQADVRQHQAREIPMLILTNAGKTYGACCILYPKVLEQLAERVDGDYYLIPSSVHEFILLPVDQGRSAEELKEMIVEVNSTELTPEEILSDQLYLYSSQERCVKIL